MRILECLPVAIVIGIATLSIIVQASADEYICDFGETKRVSNSPCLLQETNYTSIQPIVSEEQLLSALRASYGKEKRQVGVLVDQQEVSNTLSGTPLWREIYRARNSLSASAKEEILSMAEPTGLQNTYTTPQGHFVMHYTTADGTPDKTSEAYARKLGGYLEYSWDVYVNVLGFHPPTDNIIDVNIKNLDDKTPAQTGFPFSLYIFMDFDSCNNESGQCREVTDNETKTNAAHEMFHAIQTAYDFGEEHWIAEGTANWAADVAFDDINLYFIFINYWAYNPPLINPDYSINKNFIAPFVADPHVYTTVLYWKFFSEHYGTDGPGRLCFGKCYDTYCGADIMKLLMERTISDAGIRVVENTLLAKGKNWLGSFLDWLTTNYAKALGNPTMGGAYDYCEDEESSPFGIGYIEQTLLRTYVLSNNQNLSVPIDSVNPWAADYIKITPAKNIGKIAIKFDGYRSEFLNPHDFSVRALFIKENYIKLIYDKALDADNDAFVEKQNEGYDEVVLIVSGKNYGGAYAVEVDGFNSCTDSDKDGYNGKSLTCPIGNDCNDANADINPGKAEACNNVDDNCNGLVDEGFDKDGDGYTTCNGDCNDNNAAVSPGAQEVCGDGVDNNCNGQQNEGCACSNGAARQCGTDAGECEFGVQTCSSGQWGACVGGVVPKPETCNGKDDDCDGQTDEIFCGGSNYCYDMISTPTSPIYAFINNVALGHKCANYWYYIDIDNDGRSEFYKLLSEGPLRTWFFCHAQDFLQPKKVADIIRSGGTSIGCTSNGDVISEISKSYCDSAYEYSYVDQSFSTPQASLYSTDMFCVVEGNNWGWNSQLLQSDQGENYLILNCGMDADCPSDQYCKKPTISNPATYYCASRCGNGVCESNENCPADSQGVETCDGVDNNCNGVIDDGLAISCSLNSNCPSSGCYQGTYRSYSCSNAGKCSSKCEFSTLTTDSDGDGYDTQCDNDCNDSDVATRPGAIEVCDGRDNNCDGAIPEDEKDADHDGVRVCQGDCNDINAAASPLLNESCSDNIDNNCNGLVNETCCTDECSPGDGMCTGDSVRNSVMVCGNHDSDLCAEWPVNQSADCGNSTYGVWSAWYCSGRNMTRNRTAVLKGCLLGACFQNNVFEFSDSNCPNGCINGFCIQLAGDINGDCIINIFDLAAVGLSFGSRYDEIIWNANADSATDGQIDIFDLAYVGVRFGDKC